MIVIGADYLVGYFICALVLLITICLTITEKHRGDKLFWFSASGFVSIILAIIILSQTNIIKVVGSP